jgi:PhnB protein
VCRSPEAYSGKRSKEPAMVQPIPEGYRTVTPYLTVDGAARLIDFVTEAFGAQESVRMDGPGGVISHAEVTLGDSVIMLADGVEGWPARPGRIHLYVEDCDATYQRALEARGGRYGPGRASGAGRELTRN